MAKTPNIMICPVCGGRLTIDYGWDGDGYHSERIVEGFSCDDSPSACFASWDADGKVVTESRIQYRYLLI